MLFFKMTLKVLLVPEALTATMQLGTLKRPSVRFSMGARLRRLISKYKQKNYSRVVTGTYFNL